MGVNLDGEVTIRNKVKRALEEESLEKKDGKLVEEGQNKRQQWWGKIRQQHVRMKIRGNIMRAC